MDLLASDVQWVDAVSKSTGDPSRIKYTFETWNARLERCMEGSKLVPSVSCLRPSLRDPGDELILEVAYSAEQ